MRRMVSKTPVALLTFLIGVLISPIRFEPGARGHGIVLDGGGGFSSQRFRSSYFTDLWIAHAGYPSPEKAREVFEARLSKAVKVVERTQKFNGRGEAMGERAVAVFAADSGEQYASAFWTEGKVLSEIYSPSLMHVYAFEEQEVDR